MAYVRAGVTRHNLPSNPEFWVELRNHKRSGDRRAANEASTVRYLANLNEISPEDWHHVVDRTDDGEKGLVVKRSIDEYNRVLLTQRIAAWNLTNEDEQLLEITPETVDVLEPEDFDFLFEKLDAEVRPKEQEGPFAEPSNPSSEESPTDTQTP